MKFVGTYSCGYCGCDEYRYIEADTPEQAEEYMQEGLNDYAETWEHMALQDFDMDECDEEDDDVEAALDWFYQDCEFTVREADEDEAICETFVDIRNVG